MTDHSRNTFAAQPGAASAGSRAAAWGVLMRRIPKVELHVHVVGSLRASTLAAFAAEAGLALPRPAHALYQYRGFYDFIEIFRLAARSMCRAAHFERAVHEYVQDAQRAGALAHVEFFFNPSYLYAQGVPYRTQLEGLLAGARAAERDFGVTVLLIPSIDREFGDDVAQRVVEEVLADRREEVVGLGLDGPEDRGPPERFAALFQRAGAAGLRRTAHVCEDYAPTPAANYLACRDLLGCERFDHGYRLLTDPAVVARARADGAFFTCCPKPSTRERDALRLGAIAAMCTAGLGVTLATDDPAMFATDLGEAYERALPEPDLDALERLCLAGVDACWLDAGRRDALRLRVAAALTQARAEWGAAAPASAGGEARGRNPSWKP